jgi:cardiolipin synthase
MAGLVIGRDLTILGGALVWHWWIQPLEAQPSRLSKATTALQIGLALLWLVHLAGWTIAPALLEAGLWLVAAVTIASGLDYVLRWGGRALRHRRDG